MKAHVRLVIFGATLIFLLVTTFSYTYIKRRNDTREANRLYQQGLTPAGGKDNPFLVDRQLAYYDSLAALPNPSDQQAKMIQFFRGFSRSEEHTSELQSQ